MTEPIINDPVEATLRCRPLHWGTWVRAIAVVECILLSLACDFGTDIDTKRLARPSHNNDLHCRFYPLGLERTYRGYVDRRRLWPKNDALWRGLRGRATVRNIPDDEYVDFQLVGCADGIVHGGNTL